jgi:hypothetical protein
MVERRGFLGYGCRVIYGFLKEDELQREEERVRFMWV